MERIRTTGSSARRALMACALAALGLAVGGTARAQTMQDMMQNNAQFDAMMNNQLNALMQQNQANMQAMWQTYLQQNGPRLRESYVSSGANRMMTFEQYAYQMMITADGTNVQGALDAQRQQFQGMQDANRTRQDAFNDYMAAMRRNSDATGRAVDNWDRTTLRGQGQYSGPDGNGSQWVPNQGPAGQPFGWGGNQYVQDQQGNMYQWQGNGWVRLPPR